MPNYYIVRTRYDVDDYVNKGVSAIGWSDTDFTSYTDTDKLCEYVRNTYYEGKYTSFVGRKIGEIYRFKAIRSGDVVLVPCYKGFYIGIATGNFKYDPGSKNKDLANQVVLEFIKRDMKPAFFARDGKLNALSTKLGVRGFTVLDIKQTDTEIIREIDSLIETVEDTSYQDRVIDLENKKAEVFREKLMMSLSNYAQSSLNAGGRGFEKLVEAMMKKDGFDTKVLPKTIGGNSEADADVLAVKKSLLGDDFTIAYYIQAKHYSGSSDNGIDQIIAFKKQQEEYEETNGYIALDGISIESSQLKYVLISSGEFTEYVRKKADDNNIMLIDGNALTEILFDLIDDLPDIRYQLGFAKVFEHI